MSLAFLAGVFARAALLCAAAALLLAPAAGAADGDPIATGTISLKRATGFKGKLAANGVKMKPKSLGLRRGDVDPVTGAADLRLGRITFARGNRKVVYNNLRARLGRKGMVKGSKGKLFSLRGGKVVRSGFGARIKGVKVRLLKPAAKEISERLGLNSLHRAKAGTLSLFYVPRTVKVLSGTMVVRESIAANTTGFKLFSHCVSAAPPGVSAIAPATATTAIPPVFTFPIGGGTISPAGVDGVLQAGGGLRITKNNGAFTPGACTSLPPAGMDHTNISIDLQQLTMSADRTVNAAPPGAISGAQGNAVFASLDPRDVTVTANPQGKTIAYSEAEVAINQLTAATLNTVFPNAGNPANNFADGDFLATADLLLNVR